MPDLDKPNLFAVVTWGCCGTKWLATTLNAYADIFCTHNLPGSLRRAGIQASPEQAMSLLTEAGLGYRAAGDVHGIPRDAVSRLQAAGIRVVGLTRDPIPRLQSHLALYENYGWSRRLWSGMEYAKPLYPAAKTYEELMVVHAVNMLNTIIEELALFPVYRIEGIRDQWSEFTETLLGSPAEGIPAVGRLNSHRREPGILDPGLQPIIDAVVKPEAWEAYRRLGYGSQYSPLNSTRTPPIGPS